MQIFVRLNTAVLLGTAALLVGCSWGRPTGFIAVEETITARGGLGENGIFHDALYNPESVGLTFPGYIVALDKGRRGSVLGSAALPAASEDDRWGVHYFKQRLHGDPKVHYISHIVQSTGSSFGAGNCVLYSIYGKWGNAGQHRALPGDYKDEEHEANCQDFTQGRPSEAFGDSWLALDTFGREIAAHKHKYTHVVVAVMGWNTPQIEAVRNYNALVSQLKRASGKDDFRPLFVGITWASTWTSSWVEPATRLFSYPSKADDADEVGLTWMGEVLNILSRNTSNLPKIAIGHSFGARALMSALCTGSKISNESVSERQPRHPSVNKPLPEWDLFIGWQPAFSINRFTPSGSLDGFKYTEECNKSLKAIAFTASAHDEAVTSSFWVEMAGAKSSWDTVCEKRLQVTLRTKCIPSSQLLSTGRFDYKADKGQLTYMDASNIVWFNHPNTGGGAHSDIYRPVHGRLSYSLIRNVARD